MPVRLILLARISQPFSSVFLSQQISISQNQPARNHLANRALQNEHIQMQQLAPSRQQTQQPLEAALLEHKCFDGLNSINPYDFLVRHLFCA
jgi:hypothetical protein